MSSLELTLSAVIEPKQSLVKVWAPGLISGFPRAEETGEVVRVIVKWRLGNSDGAARGAKHFKHMELAVVSTTECEGRSIFAFLGDFLMPGDVRGAFQGQGPSLPMCRRSQATSAFHLLINRPEGIVENGVGGAVTAEDKGASAQ